MKSLIRIFERRFLRPSCAAAICLRAIFAVAVLAFDTQLYAADLRVLSGGGAQPVLQVLAPKFESTTGDKVELSFVVVGAIQQKLMAGEKADILLLPMSLLDGLENAGAFRTRSRTLIGRIPIGVVVHEGARRPDISTADAVRKMLLEAGSVALPNPKQTPSGSHLVRLFSQLGIADKMQAKVTFKNAIDGGVNLVRDGQADIGLFLVTEILPVKGIRLVGTLPSALQGYVEYVAAVAGDSRSSDEASEFVKFLLDARVRPQWKAAGFEPPSSGN